MAKKPLVWQLVAAYFAIVIVSLVVFIWIAGRSFRDFYFDQLASNLEARATFLAPRIRDGFAQDMPRRVESLVKRLSRSDPARVSIVLPDGTVVADSQEQASQLSNQARQPEIALALEGKAGHTIRTDRNPNQRLMFIVLPLKSESGELLAFVRTSLPLHSIETELGQIERRLVLVGIVVALLMSILILFVSRRVSLPLERLRAGASRFAEGELDFRLQIPDTEELASLAMAMNQMASNLDEKIHAILSQKNELNAVLSSMIEGVLAVDNEERVINLNDAAVDLLQLEGKKVLGKSVQEAVRNSEFQGVVNATLAHSRPGRAEITLGNGEQTILEVHASPLKDSAGNSIGAVMVFHDVTSIRRLEAMRRDFVANVSHELRTPITSIKGFVETLLDGALSNETDARRFLSIISRHTDRLNAIVQDLLSLSRIEHSKGSEGIELEFTPLHTVIESALEACSLKAQEKNIHWTLNCTKGLTEKINGPLIEQAVINLVDNAIKYSDPDGEIGIEVEQTSTETTIRVTDTGNGIEKVHLSRLFERFYRVDGGRSRELGGTGLGLAIVKHIAQAHGGHPDVTSTIGKGSTFSIHLPRGEAA